MNLSCVGILAAVLFNPFPMGGCAPMGESDLFNIPGFDYWDAPRFERAAPKTKPQKRRKRHGAPRGCYRKRLQHI